MKAIVLACAMLFGGSAIAAEAPKAEAPKCSPDGKECKDGKDCKAENCKPAEAPKPDAPKK